MKEFKNIMEQMTPGGKFWALNYTTEATLDVRFSWQKKAAQIVTKRGNERA